MNQERLLFLREQADLTQKELGKIFGVTRVSISHWETNKSVIPLKQLNNYANYFNVSLDYILQLSDVKNYKIYSKDLDKILIGKRILKIRESNGLTQESLAEYLNTSHSTISSYENGKTLILTSFAYEIALKYKTSMDWICGKID